MTDTIDSVTDALQPVEWPIMPPRKGQSPVLFDDGYDEGWAKCLEACKAALAATKQENNMTIFALEQCVENGVDLNISDAELVLAELNTLRAQLIEYKRTGYDPEVGFFIEAANEGELAAHDDAVQGMLRALRRIISGEDKGEGTIQEQWQKVRSQLIEAQRDAERWRWLKDHARIFRQSPDMSGNHYWMVQATTTLRGPTLDAAIDAAKGEQ